jgi:hypothetical protein
MLKQLTLTALALLTILALPLQSFADGMVPLQPLRSTSAPASLSSDLSLRTSAPNPYASQPAAFTPIAANANPYEPNANRSVNPYLSNPYSTPAATLSNPYAQTASTTPVLQASVAAIPAGQNLLVRLNEPASSQTARVGDTVSSTLNGPIVVNGVVMVPAGSEVLGSITQVSEAGRLGRHGELGLKFYSIRTPQGDTISIDGGIITADEKGLLKGDTYAMDIAKGVGIAALGTGIGAVGGTAIGGLLSVAGTGAAVGTAVGAIGGIGYAALREGKSVNLAKGTHLNIKLNQAAAIATTRTAYSNY